MLKWEKDINGYNGHWMGGYIGFEDDCPLYKVGEDENGWYYEYLPDSDGMDGYDTYQEAMAAAESEAAAKEIEIDWENIKPLTWEELEEAYWDAVAHERMEIAKGPCKVQGIFVETDDASGKALSIERFDFR